MHAHVCAASDVFGIAGMDVQYTMHVKRPENSLRELLLFPVGSKDQAWVPGLAGQDKCFDPLLHLFGLLFYIFTETKALLIATDKNRQYS